MMSVAELKAQRPEFLLEPSQGYRLIAELSSEAAVTESRPGNIFVDAPCEADGIGYGAWTAINGYSPVSSYAGLDIQGMYGPSPPGSSGGLVVGTLSQYQTAIMKTRFTGWAVLVGTPYYDFPPYPEDMHYVRADLYGYEVTFDELPKLHGPWVIELYKHVLVQGGSTVPPPPDPTICPPRPDWPYVDPAPVPPRISSRSGRVRRSNP